MKSLILIITILSTSFINAFSLKDKITSGTPGDYVVTEQRGTTGILFIRSLTPTHLILEEIDIPSIQYQSYKGTWKEWVLSGAPGHTAWILYTINLQSNELEECYSYSQGVWLPTKEAQHFLPPLLSLSLQPTPLQQRKRIGPPPAMEEEDRRSLWNPSVIIEGQKIDKPSITAWKGKWPKDASLIADCEIELYFSSEPFPVWIDVKSPHYRLSLRTLDSGHGMSSPQPLVFQHSPIILKPAAWTPQGIQLQIQSPSHYSALKVYVSDLTAPQTQWIELVNSHPLKTSPCTLHIAQTILEQKLIKGHQYRWILVPVNFPSLVIHSDHMFVWSPED